MLDTGDKENSSEIPVEATTIIDDQALVTSEDNSKLVINEKKFEFFKDAKIKKTKKRIKTRKYLEKLRKKNRSYKHGRINSDEGVRPWQRQVKKRPRLSGYDPRRVVRVRTVIRGNDNHDDDHDDHDEPVFIRAHQLHQRLAGEQLSRAVRIQVI